MVLFESRLKLPSGGVFHPLFFRKFQRPIALNKRHSNPTLFLNNFPEHPVGPPIQTFSAEQLSNITRRLNYVVLQDGSLIIGRRANQIGGGHIDLAAGAPVLAAGELKIVNGRLRFVDNTSGHYLPIGPEAEAAAIRAFRNIGFDEVPYAEKVWSDSVKRWIPIDN
jgi:filamentous hemagglutinin